jgi:signal transduction histidine kinase
MVTKSNEEERQSLSTVRETLSEAMDRIRASVYDLHDESLDLRTKIEALVREFTFCPIRLDYRLEREPEKDIAYCFIAVVKEGLSNIIRHSNATQVTLALLEHPALYQLVLQDNGSQAGGEVEEGLGLRSMAHRVDALGGRLVIERSGGFRLFISIPKRRTVDESADSR